MNDALCVRGLESSCDLQGECKSFRWRNGQIFMLFSRDDRIAVNKLHHDVVRADVINLADVGMVERGNRSRFAFKTLGELCSRDLDCNQAIQACISCPIHFAHAACTNSGFYAVWSELCTGSDLRGRWNQLGSGCLLPCGMVEHPFTRGPLRQQSFNAASHLGIRIRQQRLTLFAGLLQRGVVQLLHLLPVFRVRLRAPAIRANVIARSRGLLNEKYENRQSRRPVLRNYSKNHGKRAAMIGCPQLFVSTREGYFGACTTIRLAVMVKVPLMLGMGLPSRS